MHHAASTELQDDTAARSADMAWTDSERAALEDHRRQRDDAELLARAQAELLTEQETRAAERRLQDAHVEQLIRQVAELTVAKRASDKSFREARGELDQVKRELAEVVALIGEIRDLLAAFKSGFKVLGWLGTGAKWLGAIAAAGVSIYTVVYMATHGGQPPGK